MITVGGIIFDLLMDPNDTTLLNNVKLKWAKLMLEEAQNHFLQNALFRACFPEWCPDPSKKKEYFTKEMMVLPNKTSLAKEPNVVLGSLESVNVGGHFNKIINDDLHNDDNITNAEQLESVREFVRRQKPLIDRTHCKRITVATRWHANDVCMYLIDLGAPGFKNALKNDGPYQPIGQGYLDHSVHPDDLNPWPGDSLRVYFRDIEEGPTGLLWEEKMPQNLLDDFKRDMGSYHYSCQMRNRPVAPEDQVFHIEWFKYWKVESHPQADGSSRGVYKAGSYVIPMSNVFNYLTVDPAYATGPRNDCTALVVCGHWWDPWNDEEVILVLDYIREKLQLHEQISIIDSMAQKWNVLQVGIEANAAQKVFSVHVADKTRAQWLGRHNIQIVHIKRGSENIVGKARVRRLQPFLESGRFYFADWMRDGLLQEELLGYAGGYSKAEYDDLSDATSDQLDFNPRKTSKFDPMAGRGLTNQRQGYRFKEMRDDRNRDLWKRL